MLGLIGGTAIHLILNLKTAEVAEAGIEMPTIATTTATSTYGRVVQIEVRATPIVWTPDRIKQEVERVFHDVPVMYHVMVCESGGNNDAYNPTNNSHDNGLFQISAKYHGQRMRDLKLKVDNPADNIKFARMLYDERGLQPWSASEYCWGKYR